MSQYAGHAAGKTDNLLSWQQQNRVLSLTGELTGDTVGLLWAQQLSVLQHIEQIDVSQLKRVDSIGLALLVNFCVASRVSTQKEIRLCNITPRLATLITLYNLQQLFPC